MRGKLQDRFLEVDQRRLALDSEALAQEIASFLDLDSSVVGAFKNELSSSRPEQTEFPRELHELSPGDTGWSNEEQEIFEQRCGPMMREYGYSMEPQPWLGMAPRRVNLFFPAPSFRRRPSKA